MGLLGVGAGICFPVVGGAAVAEIPGGRFATGTGINSVARQLGAVLGIALLVAIVGRPEPAEIADAFDRGWTFALGCFVLVALVAPFTGPDRPRARRRRGARSPRRSTVPVLRAAARRHRTAAAAAAAGRPRTVAEILAAVPLFAGLPPASAQALERAGARGARLRAGEHLFREGDPAGSVFIVAAGRLDVVMGDEVLRVLGPGDVVGELALLAESPRSASVRARRDSRVLEVRREDFDALLASEPGFARALLRETGAQLQASRALAPPGAEPGRHDRGRSRSTTASRWTTIVPALLGELHAGGPRRAHGRAPTARTTPNARSCSSAWSAITTTSSSPGRDGDAWAAFAVRQADRVIVVAGDGDAAPLRASGRTCAAPNCSSGRRRAGAATPWLDALRPGRLYLVRPGVGAARPAAARPAASPAARSASSSRAAARVPSRTSACSTSSRPPASRSTASAAAAWARCSARCTRSGWSRTRSTPAATRSGCAGAR